MRSPRSASGDNAHEAFVQFALVIEDRLTDLVDRPHARRIVGIIDEAAGEDFVAVAGRVKEIDCLTACNAVAGRTDVERDVVARDDRAMMSAACPTSCQDSSENAT